MKILLGTQPFQGHVAPTLPVATKLSQRGHEVLWYTARKYKSDVEATGAAWIEMTHMPPSTPARLADCIARFEAIAPAQQAELQPHADVDVLLGDPTVLALPKLWMEGGAPYVMLSMLPLLYAPPDVPLILQGTIPGFEYPHPENSNIACIGPMLPPVAAFRPSPEIDPAHWWHTIDTAKPVIHVSQGTIATDPAQLILPTLEACADLPVTVIAQASHGTLPEAKIPKNARVVDWFDHSYLLPRCAVFITNGGYSAVQRALYHGVPLIVAGVTEDKPEVADRVAWAGNGINIGTGQPMPKMIAAALTALANTPRYQERAWELAGRCRETDAAQTAALLLEHFLPHWKAEKPMPTRPYDETQQAVA